MTDIPISVRLTDDQVRHLDWMAEQCGGTRSDMLRMAIDKMPWTLIHWTIRRKAAA